MADLAIRGLCKAYGSRRVLDGLDLSIPSGSLAIVVGPNGAGKSTLLGCLAGSLKHGGEITFGDLSRASLRGRIAYLPQRLRLPGEATVGEVLRLFRSLAVGEDRSIAPDGFVPDGSRRVGELSGGQVQRVALTATLLGAPELILLDEPFANLDDDGIETASAMIAIHQAAGATIVVASPAHTQLAATADVVLRMRSDGVIIDAVIESALHLEAGVLMRC